MSSISKTVSITRPANTTAYAAGDVMNANGATTPVEIDLRAYSDAQSFLMGAQLISSNEAGTPTLTAHYFSSSFTIAADNTAFDPSDTDVQQYYLGSITYDTWKAFVGNKKAQAKPDFPFSIPSGEKVYCVYVHEAAYTPISGEVITLINSIYQ